LQHRPRSRADSNDSGSHAFRPQGRPFAQTFMRHRGFDVCDISTRRGRVQSLRGMFRAEALRGSLGLPYGATLLR